MTEDDASANGSQPDDLVLQVARINTCSVRYCLPCDTLRSNNSGDKRFDVQTETYEGHTEPEEAPPGTDTADAPQTATLPQQDSKAAGTSYTQPQAAYWQPSSYHAAPVYASGWYYQDVSKVTQGPFTKQQLQLWRQHLPMDLLVWFIDHNGGSSHSLELAKVLGDGRLLESWRKAQQTPVRQHFHSLSSLDQQISWFSMSISKGHCMICWSSLLFVELRAHHQASSLGLHALCCAMADVYFVGSD